MAAFGNADSIIASLPKRKASADLPKRFHFPHQQAVPPAQPHPFGIAGTAEAPT